MEKGKKPIQEEESFLFFLMDDQYNGLLSSSPLLPRATPEEPRCPSQTTNNISTSQSEVICLGTGSSSGSGSLYGESVLNEMELTEEDFVSNFLTMNSPELPDLEQALEDLTPSVVQNEEPSKQVVPETIVVPPVSAEATRSQPVEFRKVISPQMLAEMAVHDPKRAKRIMTNRMSATRAKEKKKLYACMLEHKAHTLQSDLNAINTQLVSVQGEGKSLNSDYAKLKGYVGMILQQIRLQDALNNQIKSEIQILKKGTRVNPNVGFMFNANAPLGKQQPADQQVHNPYQDYQHRLHDEGRAIHFQPMQQQHPMQDRYQLPFEGMQFHHLQQRQQELASCAGEPNTEFNIMNPLCRQSGQ